MEIIPFNSVDITGGFWKERQDVNAEATVRAVRDRFAETGRFAAFRCDWKEGMPGKPHFFWDSDVAKWIEGVANIIEKRPAPDLETLVDETVALIERNQCADGYFNSYFQTVEPGGRFTNRDRHELYCAGHLAEAAVAYHRATGKDALLNCVRRYMDCIDRVFRAENSAAFSTPGHEEIELALVKLHEHTGERKWLDLAKHFIDRRGMADETPEGYFGNAAYAQSDRPARELREARGHSVRACYLYSGMADVARECGDAALAEACFALFDDIFSRKLYITGGIGQSREGEAFTVPYDLHNSRAYTETCAAISLVFFASRLEKLKVDSRFGDVIETAIFNGALSGVSLDGKSFFYENPLEILHAERNRNNSLAKEPETFGPMERQSMFRCSCCPPNIVRFISSVGDYIYGTDGDTVFIRQYITSTVEIGGAKIMLETGYPYDGRIVLSVDCAAEKTVAFRIPWFSSGNFRIKADGENASPRLENGYAFVPVSGKTELELELDVSPKLVYANPLVNENAGKAAVTAGPLVYCAESVDNGENLRAIKLDENADFRRERNRELGTVDLAGRARRIIGGASSPLYSHAREYAPCELRLIPYFAFANRGRTDMCVWLCV